MVSKVVAGLQRRQVNYAVDLQVLLFVVCSMWWLCFLIICVGIYTYILLKPKQGYA